MEFNPNKCKLFEVTNMIKPIISSYSINEELLERVNEAKYFVFIFIKT